MTLVNPHHLTPLPDCMMPDGAEPCAGYSVMLDAAVKAGIRNAHLQRDVNRLRAVLQDIAQMKDDEPREPDDADWRFRALECKRVAALALSSHQHSGAADAK